MKEEDTVKKKLLLEDIYQVLLMNGSKGMTMDGLCSILKCSKKSIYKQFGSKKELLRDVYALYWEKWSNHIGRIYFLDCGLEQRKVHMVQFLNQVGGIFFRSHLYQQLVKTQEGKYIIRKDKERLLRASVNILTNETGISADERKELERTLEFIQRAIETRYSSTGELLGMTNGQFLDILVSLIHCHTKGRIIAKQVEVGQEEGPFENVTIKDKKTILKC